MIDLLPCPFCGGRAQATCYDGAGPAGCDWVIGCVEEECIDLEWFRTQADAIAAWNRRAPAKGEEGQG